MKTIGTLNISGERLDIVAETYLHSNGGRTCIEIVDREGFSFATLTTNLPYAPLEPGEFHVKTWFENEGLVAPMLATGLFDDTGKRVTAGFAEAHVWRFKPGVLESAK